jgi:hypothetical protein
MHIRQKVEDTLFIRACLIMELVINIIFQDLNFNGFGKRFYQGIKIFFKHFFKPFHH